MNNEISNEFWVQRPDKKEIIIYFNFGYIQLLFFDIITLQTSSFFLFSSIRLKCNIPYV